MITSYTETTFEKFHRRVEDRDLRPSREMEKERRDREIKQLRRNKRQEYKFFSGV